MDYASKLSWKTPGAPWDVPDEAPEVETVSAPETAIEEPVLPAENQVPEAASEDGVAELEEGGSDD